MAMNNISTNQISISERLYLVAHLIKWITDDATTLPDGVSSSQALVTVTALNAALATIGDGGGGGGTPTITQVLDANNDATTRSLDFTIDTLFARLRAQSLEFFNSYGDGIINSIGYNGFSINGQNDVVGHPAYKAQGTIAYDQYVMVLDCLGLSFTDPTGAGMRLQAGLMMNTDGTYNSVLSFDNPKTENTETIIPISRTVGRLKYDTHSIEIADLVNDGITEFYPVTKDVTIVENYVSGYKSLDFGDSSTQVGVERIIINRSGVDIICTEILGAITGTPYTVIRRAKIVTVMSNGDRWIILNSVADDY